MRRSLCAFAVLWCLGCQMRIEVRPSAEIRSAGDLMLKLKQAEAQVHRLSGEAKIQFDFKQGRGATGLLVALSEPSSMHFELLDFFGRPLKVLNANALRFGLWDATEGKYYRGSSSAENLGRFLPVNLPPDRWVSLMLGKVSLLSDARSSFRWDQRLQRYILILQGLESTQTVQIDPTSFRALQSDQTGPEGYQLKCEDFKFIDGATYPHKLSLQLPGNQGRIELRYKKITLNGAWDETVVSFTPPDRMILIEL